jgi:hypothetical protein
MHIKVMTLLGTSLVPICMFSADLQVATRLT